MGRPVSPVRNASGPELLTPLRATVEPAGRLPSFPLRIPYAGTQPLLVSTPSGTMLRSSSEGLLLSGQRPPTASAADALIKGEFASRNSPFKLAPGVLTPARPPTSAATMRLTQRRYQEATAAAGGAVIQVPKLQRPTTSIPDDLQRALRASQQPKPRSPKKRTSETGSAAVELNTLMQAKQYTAAESDDAFHAQINIVVPSSPPRAARDTSPVRRPATATTLFYAPSWVQDQEEYDQATVRKAGAHSPRKHVRGAGSGLGAAVGGHNGTKSLHRLPPHIVSLQERARERATASRVPAPTRSNDPMNDPVMLALYPEVRRRWLKMLETGGTAGSMQPLIQVLQGLQQVQVGSGLRPGTSAPVGPPASAPSVRVG